MASNRDFWCFSGNNNASGSMIDDKSKQWFGASVHSSGQDGIIVVCTFYTVWLKIKHTYLLFATLSVAAKSTFWNFNMVVIVSHRWFYPKIFKDLFQADKFSH